MIGIGIADCQQSTRINSIMYYGQIVLIGSGFAADAALIANIAPGIVAVLGGILALYMMDRVDRRTTFITWLSLTTSFHLLIGLCSKYMSEDNPLRAWILLA